MDAVVPQDPIVPPTGLRRRLGLPLLVLYGTGVTVGAGIYVLIGAVAGHAGVHSSWAFALAATVMAFTAASYAELATRYPVSAGEAAYVRAAFESRLLSTAVGSLRLATGVIAAAAVTLGGAGYIRQLIDLPVPFVAVVIVGALGVVAAWGILESVMLAGLLTLIETGGLLWIIVSAVHSGVSFGPALLVPPPLDVGVLSGITFAGLLAFFAFVGFEDLANVVEEAKSPQRNIPWAMALTLLITSLLYVLIAAIAVSAVPPAVLAASPAPLSLVFNAVAHISPATFNMIAIVSTMNTVLAQMTMTARVVYGMAEQGDLPRIAGRVDRRTGTPLIATGLVMLAVAALALSFPLERLAEGTSLVTLTIFAVVNLCLLRIRARNVASPTGHVRVPLWIPAIGLVTCMLMIISAFVAP
ncbi:amino acid permease [Bradyrhizobium sp. 83012]|uniref:Amino acid permease n=1 Tax=Bradyrhizobium aeschynomenes TaxID=2734909 RepID=A0ABX2CG17_9BRAD|nr:amino acid permease [Bradyrhizobium aeschynomenes]NPU66264.1 amino acid permease [Bradyrhizobium aeschynomenes]